ncbi:MAG: hypothetical protein IJJ28_01405 [Lentisphaeria bacterium]|nr:hypothetical protein [Lentisphaeria bacterium]
MEKEVELSIKRFMAEELQKGESLSDIQKMVNEKFSVHLTYMDIRILASELETIDWEALDPRAQEAKAKRAKEEAEKAAAAETPEAAEAVAADGAEAAAPATGKTVVELSKLARPGMMLSGTVKFASGSTAEWYIDQMGRLGLENLKGEKPTPEDVEAFQIELENVARKALGR